MKKFKMCGIYCSVNCGIASNNGIDYFLKRRGPDYCASVNITADYVNLQFTSSILWQQGANLFKQPFQQDDCVMIFNGDIFNMPDELRTYSDTEWLGEKLSECRDEKDLCRLMESLEGPYSLVFFNRSTNDLYICKDSMGRNSLIVEMEDEIVRFISTSCNSDESTKHAMELPALGLYKINVFSPKLWTLFPWEFASATMSVQIENLNSIFGIMVTIKDNMKPNWTNADLKLKESFNFYEMCRCLDKPSDIFEAMLRNQDLLFVLQEFSNLLEKSVKDRVLRTPQKCAECLHDHSECNHAKIAILFSGGIDCSILASISSKYINETDPIDLINVAFEKVGTSEKEIWDVPDRLSAKMSLLELQKLHPQRRWNYVEVNVSREELHTNLQHHVKHLIFPLNTILDESLGCAFWFASRGKGICLGKEYTSPARVVIAGSGADELFGGYTRHRNAFCRHDGNETEKIANLQKELEKDWRRISTRNLSRDDRVVADNSKTLRTPFIEENLVQFISSFSPSQLCCFLLKEGIGDKLFLRIYAYNIGLKKLAYLKKRAIQFGSKIANKKQNAADRSPYL